MTIKDKKILIIALGAGGDIISSCNVKWTLDSFNNISFLSFFDFYNVAGQHLHNSLKKINNVKGLNILRKRFFANIVANELDEDVFAINSTILDSELINELDIFCKKKNIDIIIGVDGGGDVFANYQTKILNVLPDTFGLKILSKLTTPSLIAILAPTADRELSLKQWELILSESYKVGFENILDIQKDKFELYANIQDASKKAGKSYVNNVIKLAAEGYVGNYKTPYGFTININPYQRFIYLFKLDFVLKKNGFLKDISLPSYKENLNNLAIKLQSKKIISGELEEIKKRLDD